MKKGEITVFLALLLSCICGFICIAIESARTQAMRLQIERLMDMGMHSCFGEFHQELFRRYDLLYIDMSYGGGKEGTDRDVLLHLEEYIEENLEKETAGRQMAGDWCRLSVNQTIDKQFLLASDKKGHVLRNQAVSYLKNYGDSTHSFVTEQGVAEIAQVEKRDFMGEWEAVLSKADSFGKAFSNPSKKVKEACSGNVLTLTTVNAAGSGLGKLSAVSFQDIPSGRSLKNGKIFQNLPKTAGAEALFDEYLLQKCIDYTDFKNESVLSCELEYILYGNASDRENLEATVLELMTLREAENIKCLFADEGMQEEAEKLAKKLVGGYGISELTKAVQDSILYAWAYAESAIEVSCLLAGGKVKILKSSGDWRLPLEKLLEFRTLMGRADGVGLSYEEYLGVFLRGKESDTKIMRCMDIIEMNMRVWNNPSFRIDGCLEYLEAEVFFESSYGYQYQIQRSFGYELPFSDRSD